VTLRSGEKLSLRQERPCGRAPEDPIPPERLKAKFESCAARVLRESQVTRLHAALDELQDVVSMREVVREMETAGA
jgi:hypothetical protein